jgi:hypothetical protein
MSENPPLWGRMFAWVQGEIPTTTLEAYRRASGPVFELMDRVEARRQACLIDGLTPWTIPSATRAELLCAWTAFVLQTLGNDLLDADYSDYPPTAGYVPPVTAQQVMAFFGEVEGWVDRAHQAYANPDYLLDVEVPAALPPWCDDDAPPSHLRGLLEAMRAVGDHVAAAIASLPETVEDPDQRAQLNRIRQLHASAQGKARYATDLHGNDPPPDVQDRAEPYARQAIEMFYELGQLVADPTLAARNQPPSRRAIAPGKPAASKPKPAPRKPPPHPAPLLKPAPEAQAAAPAWGAGLRPVVPHGAGGARPGRERPRRLLRHPPPVGGRSQSRAHPGAARRDPHGDRRRVRRVRGGGGALEALASLSLGPGLHLRVEPAAGRREPAQGPGVRLRSPLRRPEELHPPRTPAAARALVTPHPEKNWPHTELTESTEFARAASSAPCLQA